MSTWERPRKQTLTVADLCRAIEERRLPTRVRDGMYEVRPGDLRRLAGGEERPRMRPTTEPHRSAS
jgi:hypothetical protein